ncbi:MAG: malonic semialdehyde reductase [Sphingomonadales bacterium]|nr:malonic semialdehyde reductase [Sphingomonadales bacterium]MDE2569589.1 malonic semialdehyde reductase [Sphingomonadales bacterium]
MPGVGKCESAIAVASLFERARTYNAFEDRPVPIELLRTLYDHVKWGPTAANSCPARFVFVVSAEGKARLAECVNPGNVAKVASAPVTVIIAGDSRFPDEMPKLFPSRDYRTVFSGKDDLVADMLARNVPLQGGYLILAARALGLDCGPMSGFDAALLDAAFLADGRWRSSFICALGYGRDDSLLPRNPRLAFEDACRII